MTTQIQSSLTNRLLPATWDNPWMVEDSSNSFTPSILEVCCLLEHVYQCFQTTQSSASTHVYICHFCRALCLLFTYSFEFEVIFISFYLLPKQSNQGIFNKAFNSASGPIFSYESNSSVEGHLQLSETVSNFSIPPHLPPHQNKVNTGIVV